MSTIRFKRRERVAIVLILGCAVAGVVAWAVTRGDHAKHESSSNSPPAKASSPSTERRPPPPPPPPADGYFHVLAPGAGLPSEKQCAARVHKSAWEPRPENKKANHTVPSQPVSLARYSQYTDDWNNRYRTRVSGNFTGTTDEVIQWASCKWGWSDNLVRAEAIRESDWHQSNEGDLEPRARGHCTYDENRDPCPTSFGIMQVKWYFHPAVSNPRAGSSYPLSLKSTAFNIDLQVAELRGCYDGMSTYLGNTRGDLWGCVGYWFSGAWHVRGSDDYAKNVQERLDKKAWRSW